jgi:PAS domain S-box-containing protein
MKNAEKIQVLLVEDNSTDALTVEDELSRAPSAAFSVLHLERLSQALDCLKSRRFDVVLLDLSLPDSNGLDTFTRLHAAIGETPIVVLSGRDDEKLAAMAVQSGAQDYLIKGHIEVDVLARSIRYAIERRRAERTLADSEERYRRLIEQSPYGYMVHCDGSIVFANAATLKILGAERVEQLAGRHYLESVSPELHDLISRRVQNMNGGENNSPMEINCLRLDGATVTMEISSSPFVHEGRPAVQVVLHDLTEEKKNKEALDLFRALMEHSLDAIEVIDPDTGRFIDFNATACDSLGYSRQELLSRCIADIVVEGESEVSVIGNLGEARETGFKVMEGRHRRKDGSSFPVEINLQHIELNRGYIVAVVRDITERKRTEARFRRLVDSNAQGVFFWNMKGEITGANDSFLSLLHYSRDDLKDGQIRWNAITPPEYADLDQRALEDIAFAGACLPYEKQFIRKDGSRLDVLIGAATFEDDPGEGVAFALDLTERKRAAGQIAEQAALLDEARDGILVREINGTILSWNKGAERLYGWTRQEVVGGNVCAFQVSDENEFNHINKLLLDKGEWQGESRQSTKDGRIITVEGHWTLIRDDAGNPKSVLCINSDITEKKNIEAQFMRAQRMESIGTLAGGVAHDLNNILSPIMMAIEILKSTANDRQSQSILRTIEVSARRGADIVRQVLSFARGIEGSRVEIQPRHLLMEIETIIKNTFPKNISLRFTIPTNLSSILGDPTQVHQIVLNLCVNARDAMPDGGTLEIDVDDCVLDENHSSMAIPAKAGRYVHIAITDSGTGIPREIIERIFEPFFTTKDIEKGTGLGLSTVMAIIKSHDGNISVSSEPGKGTTFNVYLPSMEMSSKARKEQDDELSMPAGNGETILVIDDEAAILSISQQTLQTFGYSVLTALDGAEAVAIYAQHRHEIAVVLTDMSMPIMDGVATINALRRINPAVKIVAASGLASVAGTARNADARVKHFLAKPFDAGTLLKVMRAILDEG